MNLSKARLKTVIQSLEERLLERQTRLDPNALKGLLAADFVEIGENGVAWTELKSSTL